MLDVLSLSGRFIAKFNVDVMVKKVSPGITLEKLDYVTVPLLKWNGRRNKLLTSFGAQKRLFDATKLVLIGQVRIAGDRTPRNCLMVMNLINEEIEKLKILSFIDTR